MKFLIVYFLASLWSDAQSTCVTPLGEKSDCVPVNKCPPLVSALQHQPLPERVRSFLRQSLCGYDGSQPKVCCGPLPKERTSPTLAPVVAEDSNLAPSDECGIDSNGYRIFGGKDTDLDEFPWMALLGYRTPKNKVKYQCGGSLINQRYILTAAHCVTGAITVTVGKLETVRLGEYDLRQDVDCVNDACADPPQEIAVHTAYPHPGFSDRNRNRVDDIALIRLAQRANYTYFVQPICLSDGSVQLEVGNEVYVAGWGQTLNDRFNSPVKQKVKLPVYEKENCVQKYRSYNAQLGSKQICAGGVYAEDTCTGDSGGPLMRFNRTGVWESVAVVSFGHGCGMDGWPGVYTSVPHYLDWIQATLRDTNV